MRVDQEPSGHPRNVIWVMLAAMAVIGFAPILVRWAGEAPPMAVVTWRTIFAVALLAPFVFARAGDSMRRMERRDWALTILAGAFLGLHFSAWTASIYHTSVASASVLVTSSPLFIAIMGWVLLRERLAPRTILAILAGVAGAVMISLGDSADDTFPRAALGNTLALSAALLVAIYFLIGRAVRQRTPLLAYLFPVYLSAAVVAIAITVASGVDLGQSYRVLFLCFLLALGPQLIAHGAFNYAVRFLPAAVIGLATLSEPVVGSLLAVAFFAEIPSTLAIAGMGMVLLAIGATYIRVGRAHRAQGPED